MPECSSAENRWRRIKMVPLRLVSRQSLVSVKEKSDSKKGNLTKSQNVSRCYDQYCSAARLSWRYVTVFTISRGQTIKVGLLLTNGKTKTSRHKLVLHLFVFNLCEVFPIVGLFLTLCYRIVNFTSNGLSSEMKLKLFRRNKCLQGTKKKQCLRLTNNTKKPNPT